MINAHARMWAPTVVARLTLADTSHAKIRKRSQGSNYTSLANDLCSQKRTGIHIHALAEQNEGVVAPAVDVAASVS